MIYFPATTSGDTKLKTFPPLVQTDIPLCGRAFVKCLCVRNRRASRGHMWQERVRPFQVTSLPWGGAEGGWCRRPHTASSGAAGNMILSRLTEGWGRERWRLEARRNRWRENFYSLSLPRKVMDRMDGFYLCVLTGDAYSEKMRRSNG